MNIWIQRGQTTNQPMTAQTLTAFLGIFAALATIFVLIVSITDGIREHRQKSWPQATAAIERCSVDAYVPLRSGSRTPVWFTQCRIGYWTDFGQIKTSIRSGSTGSSWGGHLEEMQKWV